MTGPEVAPDGRPVHARNAKGQPICGANTKHGPCGVISRMRNGRCNAHGGKATGRPITVAKMAAGQHYPVIARIRAECELLARDEAALLNTLPVIAKMHTICEKLEARVESGDTPELRKRALDLYEEAQTASASKQGDVAVLKMRQLGTLLRDGVSLDRAIEGWAVNLERTAKRIEATLNTRIARDRALSERDMQKILVLWMGMLLERYDDNPACLEVLAEMRRGLEAAMGSLYPRDVFLDPNGAGNHMLPARAGA